MEELLKKILKCLYVIIVILIIITILFIASLNGNGNSSSSDDTTSNDTTEETEYDVSMFTSITGDEFVDKVNSSDLQLIYMGRSTCHYCVQFLPILQQAQNDYGYETLYLDITTVTSDQQEKIVAVDEDFFNDNYGATPTVLLVKDGKIVDSQVGYSDYDTFASFLEKNGYSK